MKQWLEEILIEGAQFFPQPIATWESLPSEAKAPAHFYRLLPGPEEQATLPNLLEPMVAVSSGRLEDLTCA